VRRRCGELTTVHPNNLLWVLTLQVPQVLLRFDLRVAAARLMELRALCSCDDAELPCELTEEVEEHDQQLRLCTVSRALELHPALLVSTVPIPQLATAAADHLAVLAPHRVNRHTAFQVIRQHPEWLFSLFAFDSFDMLPLSVQNAVTPVWDEWNNFDLQVSAFHKAWDVADVGERERSQWDE